MSDLGLGTGVSLAIRRGPRRTGLAPSASARRRTLRKMEELQGGSPVLRTAACRGVLSIGQDQAEDETLDRVQRGSGILQFTQMPVKALRG